MPSPPELELELTACISADNGPRPEAAGADGEPAAEPAEPPRDLERERERGPLRVDPSSRSTASPAAPCAASCRRVPGDTEPPPALLPLPGPEVGWLQPAPGMVSSYWLTPELPGGAQLAAAALAGSASATAQMTASRHSFITTRVRKGAAIADRCAWSLMAVVGVWA